MAFQKQNPEVYWGVFAEIGGPRLALWIFAKRILHPSYSLVYPGHSLVKTVIVFIILTVLDAALSRYKPDRLLDSSGSTCIHITYSSYNIAFSTTESPALWSKRSDSRCRDGGKDTTMLVSFILLLYSLLFLLRPRVKALSNSQIHC